MSQNAKKALLLTLILTLAIGLTSIQFRPSCASRTLTVPADYTTISEAINHAGNDDTIVVQSGVYHENLEVNKSVTIMGSNSQNTIIIGEGGVDRGSKFVVYLNANGAEISGFTIQSQNYTTQNFYASGINVHADRCTIKDSVIQDCYMGIFSSVQSYTEVSGNTIRDNLKDGMRFYGGSYNTIQNNSITGNAVSGVALQGYSNTIVGNIFEGNYRAVGLGASYSVVYGNKILSDSESGLFLVGSNNIVAANEFQQNKWSIYITPQMADPYNNTFFHNNFMDNTNNIYVNESSPPEFWDNGAQGNFWSDYQTKYPNATEKGGIGDSPYIVYPGAKDNFPLTSEFDISAAGNPPATPSIPQASSNGLVAYWPFDKVDSTGISPDQAGHNPAILGSTTAARSYLPKTVDGEVGKALSFDGQEYISVPSSPSLEIGGEVTVDVWINAQAYKDIPYNNIIVEALRTTAALPTRTFGLAINGESPQNDSAPPIGALRGYVYTEDGLNEIDTVNTVVPLNQWIHVVFTRSLITGMHIYVDGKEQQVKVFAGIANPQGDVVRQTETYIGHDSICTIDELKLSNTAQAPTQPIWVQWWLWAIVFATIVGCTSIFFKLRRSKSHKKSPIF